MEKKIYYSFDEINQAYPSSMIIVEYRNYSITPKFFHYQTGLPKKIKKHFKFDFSLGSSSQYEELKKYNGYIWYQDEIVGKWSLNESYGLRFFMNNSLI